MIRRLIVSLLVSLPVTLVWGQCPDALTVAKQIRAIKDGPLEAWQPACSRLKKQLEQCRAVRDSNYAEVLFLLGYTHSSAGDNQQAIQLTRQSIQINSRKSSESAPAKRIQAYYYLGNYLKADNQPSQALDAYQRCITLGRNIPIHLTNVTRALVGQALVLYSQGDYEQALGKAQQGYQLARPQNDKLLLAECTIEIARNQVNLGNLAQAETMARSAIELAKQDPYGADVENVSRGILAIIFRSQNRVAEALHELEISALS